MQRIGFAASKISKGSLLGYNLCVVLIASIFSLFIFLLCGFLILLVMFLIFIILHMLRPSDMHGNLVHIYKISLIILAFVVGCFNILAIAKNIQLTKEKI